MYRRLPASLLVAALVSPLAGAAAHAQAGNLVPNGRFDDADEVDGWSAAIAGGTLDWAELRDDDFCTGSGAARATSTTTGDDTTVFFHDCISAVVEGESYRLAASFWFEEGVFDGWASANPLFFNQTNCGGGTVPSPGFFVGTAQSTVSNWQRFSIVGTAPAGAASAQMRFQLVKEIGTDPQVQVLVDEIYFGPGEYLFAEDFEVGSDCRWSYSTNDDL